MLATVCCEEGKPATWGLDPLFHTHVKLFLNEVQQSIFRPAVDAPNAVYADAVRFIRFSPGHRGRPVRLVHVEGYIVHVTHFHKSLRLMIDDGSAIGIINVWREGSENVLRGIGADELVLGEYLSVRGRLDWRRGTCEITAMQVVSWADPNAELAWWLDVVDAHEKVYCRPPPPVPLHRTLADDAKQAGQPDERHSQQNS